MTGSTMSSPADLERAVSILRRGGVIAMPTDTLYALVAAARDAEAVRRVFAMKGRKFSKPLPLFVSGLAMAERIAVFNPHARRLAGRFWPGPLTIVLPKQPAFESEALAGGDTVALRVPDHDLARAVVEALDAPVTATSANRSSGRDPVSPEEVLRQLDGEVDFLLDAGPCPVGFASTVVDCTGPELHVTRQGALTEHSLLNALA